MMEAVRRRSVTPEWRKASEPSEMRKGLHNDGSGALPSINYLDLEKIKRENSDSTQRHPSSGTVNVPVVSPSTMYSGPPPPYSYTFTSSTSVGGINGYISPPESRRTSDDDDSKELPPQPLLPSIHEALGRDQPLPYSSAPHQPVSLSHASHTSSAPTPPTPIPRSHPDALLSGPPNPYAQGPPLSSYAPSNPSERRPPSHYPNYSQSEGGASRPSISTTQEPSYQPRSSNTASSPRHPPRPNVHTMQPQHSSPTYGQTPYGSSLHSQTSPSAYYPPYSNASPAIGVPSYLHQYMHQPTWRSDGSEIDRAEEMRKAAPKESPTNGQAFGESVKRHLDIFDLETSLNEIAEGSGRALDFSRHYGNRAHHSQRSGPLPGSLPSLTECDEMIRHQHRVLDSMARIREVIITQQHALAEQRTRDQAQKAPSEFSDEANSYQDKLEGAGGFAGADPKKRRGRNAPPGRCHSCNRAETPEWRRGPDGARTLCNACGLHYAKLTRKMGSKASLSGSNLRPKEGGSGSP
ncbi:hypothetical protein MMC20_005726 [Loxospora ochrophaea]|nr:hypothetical protein [Loxospora ochrophaea]